MTADLTLLQRAIKQVVADFPVYRTYLDFAGMPADADRRDITWAMTRARRSDPMSILRLRFPAEHADGGNGTTTDARAQHSAAPASR
jgi:maltooligosyltrehalose synthase